MERKPTHEGARTRGAAPKRRGGPSPAQLQAAEESETHYLRMRQLRDMDATSLKTALSGPPEKVAPWIETAARYGLADAQIRLGQMHLDGIGVPLDPTRGLSWFERAARAGSAEAMNMVGRCLENGWGAALDLEAAARWYRLSAEAGHDWGEYNYANMLFDGRGVGCDREQAVRWYRRASDQGHARAMNLLARCIEEGWGAPRNPAEACEWYRRSAEAGYFRAQYNYATLLVARGRTDQALPWFETACRDATEESRRTMVLGLIRQGSPPVATLGRRLARELAVPA